MYIGKIEYVLSCWYKFYGLGVAEGCKWKKTGEREPKPGWQLQGQWTKNVCIYLYN